MKKYIVTAYYADQYQLELDLEEGDGFWIEWGTLCRKSVSSDEILTFEPVSTSDRKYPNKVEVRYDDAIFDDDE